MKPVLVDTSVWIAFFNGLEETRPLERILHRRYAYVHPWVRAELRLGGGVPARAQAALLRAPAVAPVSDAVAWRLLESYRLDGSGIGWVDLHLLASAHARGIALWTLDGALASAARKAHLPAVSS